MRLMPMYWLCVGGGLLYVAGVVLCIVNAVMTWKGRPARYEEPVHQAPALSRDYVDHEPPSRLKQAGAPVAGLAYTPERFVGAAWHRRWERLPRITFTVWTTIAVVTASLFEIVPTFLFKSNVPTIATVNPYTALEAAGRDVYIAEGCNNCHSQMVRPTHSETQRYGEYSKPGEFVYDHLWGSKRTGPDLHRVGGKYPDAWHFNHMDDPHSTSPRSIMPAYPWLLTQKLDTTVGGDRMRALRKTGVPYTDAEIQDAPKAIAAQAQKVVANLAAGSVTNAPPDREIIALIASPYWVRTEKKTS